MNRGKVESREVNPREKANFFSLLSFGYTIPLFVQGFKKALKAEDLFKITKSCRANQLTDLFEREWTAEEKDNLQPSIINVLVKCFGLRFLLLGVIQCFFEIVTTLYAPLTLSKLLSYFSPNQTELTLNDAIFYAVGVVGIGLMYMVYYHNIRILIIELGLRVHTGIVGLMYRRILSLNVETFSKGSIGKIITIITRDIDCFEVFLDNGNDIWIGMIKIVVVCWMIYSRIGVASFAGILYLVLILPLKLYLGQMAYHLRLKIGAKMDKRLNLIQEVLSSIKIVKMYTWEQFFKTKIHETRKNELKQLHKLFYTKVTILILGHISAQAAFFCFIICYIWMGNDITAETIFFIMACFRSLASSFTTIPLQIFYAAEVYAASKRIESLLCKTKQLSNPMILNIKSNRIELATSQIGKKIHLDQQLNVIIGTVGSGKTTLLKQIIKSVVCNKSPVTISYASQEPWLFPSSIKYNILFGELYDQKRYEEVLNVCCLKYDLEMFPDSDETVVSDQGINLSKGQQARINLARAVYRNCNIYLLDDCLAALDAKVSDDVFRNCIRNFLLGKVVVFVTNNVEYISKAQQLVIVQNGEYTLQSIETQVINDLLQESLTDTTYHEEDIAVEEKIPEVYDEFQKSGSVDLRTYHSYIQFGGGYILFSFVFLVFMLTQANYNYSDKLMSQWITLQENSSSYLSSNQTKDVDFFTIEKTKKLYWFMAVTIGASSMSFLRYVAFFFFTRTASTKMHKLMVDAVLNAKLIFFDTTHIGNILNRFSTDCLIVDGGIPFILIDCVLMVFVAGGGLILITSVHWIFSFQCLVLLLLCCLLKGFYQPTGRNLQRLRSITHSPVIGHFVATLEGLSTIHASNAKKTVIDEFHHHQNLFTSATFTSECHIEALIYALDLVCITFTTLIIIQFLSVNYETTVGDVGMVITQCFSVSDYIIFGIRNLAQCENKLTSLERILEYVHIEDEKIAEVDDDINSGWRCQGALQFSNVSLSLGGKKQTVLRNVSFELEPCTRLGVVGRTGAGKSSILSVLFKLYEFEGLVTLDGVNIRRIPFLELRRRIAIIPQDPFVFSGTVRENLDPFGQYSDAAIWSALEKVQLKDAIENLNDSGLELSSGQKQLFSMARAKLSNAKVVVFDEPTANCDQQTDDLIQDVIRTQFTNSTVIIIAHRLHSVLKCHRMIVLERGEVCKIGSPKSLLKNTKTIALR